LQSRPALLATLVVTAMALAGCSTIMMPLNGWSSSQATPPADELTTGSIGGAKAPAPDSDAEMVRRTVETAVRTAGSAQLAWTNPTSGNSGTVSELVEARAKNGAPCRDFATTLATIQGISLWRGRACQGYSGPWDLVDFGPAGETPAG